MKPSRPRTRTPISRVPTSWSPTGRTAPERPRTSRSSSRRQHRPPGRSARATRSPGRPTPSAGTATPGSSRPSRARTAAIGYVDFSDAKAAGLSFASIKNKDGKYIEPSLKGTSAALAQTTVEPNLTYDPLYTAGAESYPIATPTWILVYTKQTDKAIGAALKGYLDFVYGQGQEIAPTVDYAALPDSLAAQGKAQISQIQVPTS